MISCEPVRRGDLGVVGQELARGAGAASRRRAPSPRAPTAGVEARAPRRCAVPRRGPSSPSAAASASAAARLSAIQSLTLGAFVGAELVAEVAGHAVGVEVARRRAVARRILGDPERRLEQRRLEAEPAGLGRDHLDQPVSAASAPKTSSQICGHPGGAHAGELHPVAPARRVGAPAGAGAGLRPGGLAELPVPDLVRVLDMGLQPRVEVVAHVLGEPAHVAVARPVRQGEPGSAPISLASATITSTGTPRRA